MTALYKEMETVKKSYSALITERTNIMVDKFHKKKYAMEIVVRDKLQNIVRITHNATCYKNKIKTYGQYENNLKDLNMSLENSYIGKLWISEK